MATKTVEKTTKQDEHTVHYQIDPPELRRLFITLQGSPPGLLQKRKPMGPGEDPPTKLGNYNNKEFLESLYPMSDDRWGHPAEAFRLSAKQGGASKAVKGLYGNLVASAIVAVVGEKDGLVEIKGEPQPMKATVPVAKGNGSTPIVYAHFPEWTVDLEIIYRPNIYRVEKVLKAFEYAGYVAGVGCWRIGGKGAGPHGGWMIVAASGG